MKYSTGFINTLNQPISPKYNNSCENSFTKIEEKDFSNENITKNPNIKNELSNKKVIPQTKSRHKKERLEKNDSFVKKILNLSTTTLKRDNAGKTVEEIFAGRLKKRNIYYQDD